MNPNKLTNNPASNAQGNTPHPASQPVSVAPRASRWQSVRDLLLSPPTHLAHYRELRARLFLRAADAEWHRDCPQ